MTLTPTEIPQALAALREALEVGKLYAVRHAHEHATGAAAIRKIDDGREAAIVLQELLQEAKDTLAFYANNVQYLPSPNCQKQRYINTDGGQKARATLARLDAALKEG